MMATMVQLGANAGATGCEFPMMPKCIRKCPCLTPLLLLQNPTLWMQEQFLGKTRRIHLVLGCVISLGPLILKSVQRQPALTEAEVGMTGGHTEQSCLSLTIQSDSFQLICCCGAKTQEIPLLVQQNKLFCDMCHYFAEKDLATVENPLNDQRDESVQGFFIF